MAQVVVAGLMSVFVALPLFAQGPVDRNLMAKKSNAPVAPKGVPKEDVFQNVVYVAGHASVKGNILGQLVVQRLGLGFFDNKGKHVFSVPIGIVQKVDNSRDIRDPSVGQKLLFGGLAGDRKQDFLSITTETDSTAEGIVFRVSQNASPGLVAKISFYVRKARELPPGVRSPDPEEAGGQPTSSAVRDSGKESVAPRRSIDGQGVAPSGAVLLANDALRSSSDLLRDTEFRLNLGDAQRLGYVISFHEIGSDTLAVDVSDLAVSSDGTERYLARVWAAYRRITGKSNASLLIQHDGLSVGEYTATGLAKGDWR